MKYQNWLQWLATTKTALLQTGAFRESTLDSYLSGVRRARPVTIMLSASLMGASYTNFI